MWGLLLVFIRWLGLSPVPFLAYLIGTTEPALNLLISILMAYPIAILFEKYEKQISPQKNMFFIITGLDIAFFNFGLSFYHNFIPVILLYCTTKIIGPTKVNVIITFIFNMSYLIYGYLVTESENYDITWTMPHCVLTLKLIALSFDLWDGTKSESELSSTNKKTALTVPPTFVELIGFVCFPACFLVGPIFSFKRYKDFISDKFPQTLYARRAYAREALIKLIQGVAYLAAFQVGVSVFNIDYMLSEEFWERSIFYRHLYCGLWAHFALYKYISCWLLTEACCARLGFSFNGLNKLGIPRWDGCSNIQLMRFETATKFQHYIESFNCNTNHFAAEYIYKRLKFLGNRNLSQLFTLLFLAVWHGTRSGYYMTFINEFMIIYMEKELEPLLNKMEIYHKLWSNTFARGALYALLKMYTIVFMGWSLVPFDVKTFSKWFSIYWSLYFSGFVLFVPWAFLYKPAIVSYLKSSAKKNK